jgi:hypothetical protein
MKPMPAKLVMALAVLAAGCLAAGCGNGSIRSALSGAAASRSISAPAPTISPPAVSRPTLSPPTVSRPTSSPRTRPPEPSTEPATPAETTAPETTEPATTEPATPPSTAAETSQPPATEPAAPPAPAPSPQTPAAVSASPVASEPGSSLLWLWIVLAVIIIVAVAVLIARRSGRRSSAAANWRAKVVDVTANGSALYDAMSAAQAPGAQAAGDAGGRWADIQRRGDDLNTQLYALREMAPDAAERLLVADVLAALHAVRSAMDAERAAGAAGPPQDARVPGLLQAFEASLRALRSLPGPGDPL